MSGLELLLCTVLACMNLSHGATMDPSLYCSACRVLIDETQYKIGQVDPKKTIQVGSFRVDPSGNQGRYEVPYATSETHLIEVFESLCGSIAHSYARSTDKASGKKKFTRTSSRDGEALSLSNIEMGADSSNQLRSMCEHLLEEHEEEFISILQKYDVEQVAEQACVSVAEACSVEDLTIPLVEVTEPSDETTDEPPSDEQTEADGEAPSSDESNESTLQEKSKRRKSENFDDFELPEPDRVASPTREASTGESMNQEDVVEVIGDEIEGQGDGPHAHEEL